MAVFNLEDVCMHTCHFSDASAVSVMFCPLFRLKKLEEKRQKAERQRLREEKRKQRQLMKLKEKETQEMNMKIAVEEKKLLIAQRKLESIRLLDELFERVKVC
jgi:Zn-finger protein